MKKFGFKGNFIKPKIKKYSANQVKITRAGLSSNPVERFNFVSGVTFANDALVKHGESFFVGGNVATHEFSFETKVANSVVECPMKLYHTKMATLQIPSNITSDTLTGWVEDVTQANLDLLKTQDNNSRTVSIASNNLIDQMMVELDLTPLCNSVFGGSNAALKTALKAINIDVWAMGSGANASATAYGCKVVGWDEQAGLYPSYNYSQTIYAENNTSSIAKITEAKVLFDSDNMLTTSNKLFFLIASKFASDGVIPSSVSLDYLNIKIDIARTPDTVSPITVNLPKYFAMALGVSNAWDNTRSDKALIYLNLYKGANDRYTLFFDQTGHFSLAKGIANVWKTITTNSQTFSKYQVIKMLFMQTTNNLILKVLKNNGVVESYTVADSGTLSGLTSLYTLIHYNNLSQADAFAESFTLLDLGRLGKSTGLSDAEAEGILRGRINTKNLYNGTYINDKYVSSDGSIVVGVGWATTDYIRIKPSVQYVQNYLLSDSANVRVSFYDINKNFISAINSNPYTTPSNACYLITCWKYSIHDYKFQLEEGTVTTTYEPYLENPIALTNPELFDINKVTLHANASRSNGVITLNATGAWQNSYLDMQVLPNNKYEVSVGNNSTLVTQEFYNNLLIKDNACNIVGSDSKKSLITGQNTNKIRIVLTNSATGTFTFSQISLRRKD